MSISNIMKRRISDSLSENRRFDNRKNDDFREIEVETGISKNAEGSAKVKLGNTEVIVGVKIDVAEPYPDHEEEGTLITTCELLPLSSSKYESGPPRIDSIEIARIVDRGIRESGFVDFKKLCIKKGEKVYGIFLDLYSLNDNGNLIDAFCLASVAALKTTKMPKYDAKTEKIKYGELTSKGLPLTKKIPITITSHKLGENIFVDPNTEEEESSEARLSVALTNDKEMLINALQKGNSEIFTEEEMMINLVDYVLVPKHEVLDAEKSKTFYTDFKCKKRNMPKIFTGDPVARYFNMKPNDIVRITRPSDTAGSYISYRLVVKGEVK